MPYRRLPNTDAARLKALKTAFNKGRELPPFKLAFSQSAFQKAQSFLPSFEKVILETKQSYETQIDKNREYIKLMKKAKLYISHFIQVINMAILRGEFPVSERNFFKLDEDERKTPSLNTEAEIIEWGEQIIKGEVQRKNSGRSPITNPSIAIVKVRYEQFIDSHKFQKILQKNHRRAQDNLAELRPIADSIILNIWNDVETYYNDVSDIEKRQESENYGLSYVFRKNELLNMDILV